MKVVSILLLLFGVEVFGGVIPTTDEEWRHNITNKNYHKFMNMMSAKDLDVEIDLQNPPSLQSDPYIEDHVFYFVYTRKNQEAFQITKSDVALLKKSTFDPSKKTKIIIHGYLDSYRDRVVQLIMKAYLAKEDVNIVAVDWNYLAGYLYTTAVSNTKPVGLEVAQLIDFLVSSGGVDISDIHVIGHSLGAHVSAFAANNINSGKITRITGLDPALPLFGSRPADERLDPTDAPVVDCIHTCGKYLGFYVPLCTHDFYPNGGVPIQPGCGFDWYGACSHDRSFELFSSSIANKFPAQSCALFPEVGTNSCGGSWTGLMGELAPSTPAGIYILQTTGEEPYTE